MDLQCGKAVVSNVCVSQCKTCYILCFSYRYIFPKGPSPEAILRSRDTRLLFEDKLPSLKTKKKFEYINPQGSLSTLGVEECSAHQDSHEKPALRYSNETKQKQGSWLEGSCVRLQRERQKRLDFIPGVPMRIWEIHMVSDVSEKTGEMVLLEAVCAQSFQSR